jgi:rhodanese-related sulfurtransferase
VKTRLRHTLATAALLAHFGCGGAADANEVTPEQVLAGQRGAQAPLLLDVRTADEFASGHVPGAINIHVDELAARTGELDAQREVVVYCERGPRARKAADALVAAGFTDVKLLSGHMSGWRDAGLPTE